jgi:hypothetical protein
MGYIAPERSEYPPQQYGANNEECKSQAEHDNMREIVYQLILALRMAMRYGFSAKGIIEEVRVCDYAPTVAVRMIERCCRDVVAQKKPQQHKLSYTYQCLFHGGYFILTA